MTTLGLSRAGAALFHRLLARAGCPSDRILLSAAKTIEWQSLTFVGERHLLSLKVVGPGAMDLALRLVTGIEDAEFELRGHFVADIAVIDPPCDCGDFAALGIEALTVAE